MVEQKYDIGVLGWWYGENYGSILTYYALHQTLRKMGYSVLMLHEALGYNGWRVKWSNDIVPVRFAKMHYHITGQCHYSELKKYNELCDMFICGSDQIWNHTIGRVNDDCFLDFVDDEKKRISYATSFGGNKKAHQWNLERVARNKASLKKFDAISVREDYGVDIARNVFDVDAQQVVDPVFLLERKEYEELAKEATVKIDGDYLFAFILDPTEGKKNVISELAERMAITKVVVITNIPKKYQEICRAVFSESTIIDDISPNNFLHAMQNAKYVITDSFHGVCFSYIFRKNFSAFYNERRGPDRFRYLLGLMGLEHRRIYENNMEADLSQIDFSAPEKIMTSACKLSYKWLKKALASPKKKNNVSLILPSVKQLQPTAGLLRRSLGWFKAMLTSSKKWNTGLLALPIKKISPKVRPASSDNENQKAIDRALANPDTVKARILAALLRNYKIEHIVISSGSRNLTLARILENNPQTFTIYHVTDERSAGYFALGLATKLRRPVAMCCTSGTAASNYTPSITEACYTEVPIIAITCDRYPMFLNQGEDQTIPQVGMFDGIVKKSVTIPVTVGPLAEWETRRLVSEAILECTHGRLGPVHINFPVSKIEFTPPPKEVYELPKLHPHINRLSLSDDPTMWNKYQQELEASKRILVVYGQNHPPAAEQKRVIEEFTRKYNCVISADYLSNLFCEHCVHPYNMLRAITQSQWNEELSPDILITVGGKRIMNDPMTGKIHNGLASVRHWRVSPDGEIKDFYRILTAVFECNQDYFFKYFVEKAGNIKNDENYFNAWKKRIAATPLEVTASYNSLYTTGELMRNMPGSSIFHLSVGHTFLFAQRFPLQENIEVFCNMGTNGIDGCTSSFMGQAAATPNEHLCFLLVGDLSFFYDMNALWNKKLRGNIRIMLNNNGGTGLLRHYKSPAITQAHATTAEGWVKSLGFRYISATSKEEFDEQLPAFLSREIDEPIFFEVFLPGANRSK